MPQKIARLFNRLPHATRQTPVTAIADAAYERGWKDREALYLTGHATAGKAAAA